MTGAAETYVNSQVSSGGILRVVIEPSDPSVAATWAGYTFNPPNENPQLTLEDLAAGVPEPSSGILVFIGAIHLIGLGGLRHARAIRRRQV